MYYLGIDPGASGGLCLLSENGEAELWPMPSTPLDLLMRLAECNQLNPVTVVEKVWGYAGEGNPGSAMFNFGSNYGQILMALTALGIPYEEVPPQAWQKGLGITHRDKEEKKPEWKRRLKAFAEQKFPTLKLTLKTCDAALIALYCRETNS